MLEVEQEERLLFSFGKWTISWQLADENQGIRLYLEQHGLDPNDPQDRHAIENMGPGWRDIVHPQLEKVLEENRA